MILLDTNVVSGLMRAEPDPVLVAWLDRQPSASVWTTAVTVFEVEFGLARLPDGRRRDWLQSAFRSMLAEVLAGRVLAFDEPAARAAGYLAAELAARGRAIEIRDAQIAGIARARRARVATANVRHFAGACELCDPWAAG